MPQSLSAVYIHLVFSTKHRLPPCAMKIFARIYTHSLGGSRESRQPWAVLHNRFAVGQQTAPLGNN